jgi:YVTN family beta-propeller protein
MTVYAYIPNVNSNNVSVIDTSTNAVTATVTVGSNPSGVATTPNGAYVTSLSRTDHL